VEEGGREMRQKKAREREREREVTKSSRNNQGEGDTERRCLCELPTNFSTFLDYTYAKVLIVGRYEEKHKKNAGSR
jgi:hypothetical protein